MGTEWTEEAKLIASDGAVHDWFGVSISGDYALVGASDDDNNYRTAPGSAYIFHRNGTAWTEQAKLTASDGSAFDFFGTSISLSGEYALVGAMRRAIRGNGIAENREDHLSRP